jgi:hypothetical protein
MDEARPQAMVGLAYPVEAYLALRYLDSFPDPDAYYHQAAVAVGSGGPV